MTNVCVNATFTVDVSPPVTTIEGQLTIVGYCVGAEAAAPAPPAAAFWACAKDGKRGRRRSTRRLVGVVGKRIFEGCGVR